MSQFFKLKTSSGLTLFKKALCLSPELPNWTDGVAGGGDKTEDLRAYFSHDGVSPSLGSVLVICETFCFGCHVIAGYHLPSVGRARIEDSLLKKKKKKCPVVQRKMTHNKGFATSPVTFMYSARY